MCGNGGYNSHRSKQQSNSYIDNMKRDTDIADYKSDVCRELSDRLREYNQRDTEKINKRLDQVKEILSDHLDSYISLRFGGSVSKWTYVDGLSDVDCLLLLKPEQFKAESPQELLQEFKDVLNKSLGEKAKVEIGKLAVTVTFKDSPPLQLLPSLPTATGVRIAATDEDGWSQVIHPEKFAGLLTEVNQKNSGNVVPVIKLVKGAIDKIEIDQKLKGHHIETLAVNIFQNYQGDQNTKDMVQHFFEKACDLVKSPMKDCTNQSDVIDDYLGSKSSAKRERIAQALNAIAQKMKQADTDCSAKYWLSSIDGQA